MPRILLEKNRLEAFSDGVIAIIITIMVFDIKLPELATYPGGREAWGALLTLVPKILAYGMSFIVIAIMWLNHHTLIQQVSHSTSHLVWYNIHLLFWMSLIPLPTTFIAKYPQLPQACMFYGGVLAMNALGFALLRYYASVTGRLMPFNPKVHRANIFSTSLYAASAVLPYVSVYLSYIIFVLIPVMYFLPDRMEPHRDH